jgi:T4-like virus Myoviridae tail sheath stabiliser
MVASTQFFYDAQIERFLAQFIRLVSGFQVEFGKDRDGHTTLQRVPVYYGDGSRQVAQILTNNSSNSLPTVPAMTVYINGVSYDRDRVQDPTFVGKMSIRQRYYNENTEEYEQRQGNAFTIERLMPVPYTLELKLDIWTSNTKQKLQLLEQLIVLFNPAMEIQSTDNYIDWTSLSVVYLESPTWNTRSVPIGTDNPIDVATLTFKLPVWISPPAKIKKLGVVQKIVSSIHDSNGDLSSSLADSNNLLGAREWFSPLDYSILLVGNQLTLLKVQDVEEPRAFTKNSFDSTRKVGTKDTWRELIDIYGSLQNGISQVRLLQEDGISEVVGTVSYHPTDDTLLLFSADIDTYPANTLNPIDAIIDPTKNTAVALAQAATAGTRFLILKSIGSHKTSPGDGPIVWQGSDGQDLVANANDIIEYNGVHWSVSFDSQNHGSVQYVSNLTTGTQYKWNLEQWVRSWEGEYKGGLWTLVL